MANRPQEGFFDPTMTAEGHAAQIREVHERQMAEWAAVELTPERIRQLQEQTKRDIIAKVTSDEKPWED